MSLAVPSDAARITPKELELAVQRQVDAREVNPRTGQAIQTAVRKVAEASGIAADDVIDERSMRDAIERFKIPAEGFTPGSRKTYAGRVDKALRFLLDDQRKSTAPLPGNTSDSVGAVHDLEQVRALHAASSEVAAPDMMQVPVVLRRGSAYPGGALIVRVEVPIDLTAQETERIAAVVAQVVGVSGRASR